MKAVTIAAAGAALVGSVSASSHVKMMHKRLHARSDWSDWSSSTVADPETATSTTTADWPVDPATSSSTTTTVDWPVDPATSSSTTSTVVWEDWSTTTTTTSKVYDPATAKSTSTVTWEDWSSSSSSEKDAAATSSASVTWEDWSSTVTAAGKTSTTKAASTWSGWTSEEGTSTTTVSGTVTKTIYVEPASSSVVTSTVVPGWSSNGWFGTTWSTGPADVCTMNVVSSYGAPTWYPTPAATSLPVLEVTVTVTALPAPTSTSTWADWSSTSSSTAAAVTSTSQSWPAWTSTASASEWSSSASASAWSSSASASASAKPSSSSGGSSSFSPNGNSWAMTYSPYTSAGGCKDAGTVSRDLGIIASKGFTSVRVYSTDCSTLENVGAAARSNGLKVILGVFISSTGVSGAQKQVTDIVAWAQWDIVELIVVGNEAVFNGYCSASELASFISSSAWSFKNAGYTGKTTTTEPLTIWESQGTNFCGVVDVVAANLYAFFNADTTADKAGDLIQAQITILDGICPGKDAYIMESGWPTAGNCNGVACPSKENQATALKGIQSAVGAKVVFFSYEDEQWKDPGQFNVEQHWGCADVFSKGW